MAPRFLTNVEVARLLASLPPGRPRLVAMLMIDCGLRINECKGLRLSDIDLRKKTITVPRRSSFGITEREIAIPARTFFDLVRFIENRKMKNEKSDSDYLFHVDGISGKHPYTMSPGFLASRQASLNLPELTFATLRNTYIMQQINDGVPIEQLRELLGFKLLASMERFLQAAPIQSKLTIDRMLNSQSWLQRLMTGANPWGKNGKPKTEPIGFNPHNPSTVGRDDMLVMLNDLITRKINTVIVGPVGIGKSRILNAYEKTVTDSQTIRLLKIDDMSDPKSTLAQLLIYLSKSDKQELADQLFPDFDYDKTITKISRQTIAHIASEIVKLAGPKYYTLFIDNVDQISKRAAKILETFKDHFTIVTTARSIPLDRSSFIWNFQVIRLEPLSRNHSLQLIEMLSAGMKPEDLWLYKNHIYEQTNGNPRAIEEMVERYSKEPALTKSVIRDLSHTGALPEYDCTFIVIIFLACVACLRYLNHEVQNASFRVLGGIALVFLFISRYFFRFTKKKEV